MLSKIGAIARNTISQAIRMKVAFILILFLLILLPSLPYLLESDGTQRGQVQLVFTYGMLISSFLLSMLTIFLSCSVLSSEIRERQIFILDSKPVARWQVLVGKWLGVMAIDAVLLLFMAVAMYVVVVYLARPGRENATEKDQALLASEVLVARRTITPEKPEIDEEEVERRYQHMRQEASPEDFTEEQAKRKIRSDILQEEMVVKVREPKAWDFQLNPDPEYRDIDFSICFSFRDAKYKPDLKFRGQWVIKNPGMRTWLPVEQGDYASNRNHYIRIPSDFIDESGRMTVAFINFGKPDEETGELEYRSVLFSLKDGVQILYRGGGFEMNYVRALILILCRLAFLAILGIMASTFLSFPVASLFSLTVYAFGCAAGYVSDILGKGVFATFTTEAIRNLPVKSLAHRLFYEVFLYVFPNLSEFNPITSLTTGMMIEWLDVCEAIIILVVAYGGVAAVLGYIIFNRRELAGTHRM
jgi:ABC-type transport system involved in multi-copper enzyme maturation permease subunit